MYFYAAALQCLLVLIINSYVVLAVAICNHIIITVLYA